LQIYDRRERFLVGAADLVLSAARIGRRSATTGSPLRILLLRLERIGDLLMTLGAIELVRARAPRAEIHLVVGSWNEDIARLVAAVDSIETLDVPWLAREGGGTAAGALAARARTWRSRKFDLAINFEPDIRSNGLLALGRMPRRVGYRSGGGGHLLTDAIDYEPGRHTAANAERLVNVALPDAAHPARGSPAHPRLPLSDEARRQAAEILGDVFPGRLLIGVHPSGGRPVKQWHPERFAESAVRLARERGATIVLTGTSGERPLVERVRQFFPSDVAVVDAARPMTLPVFGALLERFQLFITGDTGPMHLAAAVGTPVVAIFGPSDPARYGPLTARARIVTADLWCRPCNRVRKPPERCTGRVPDCLNGVSVDAVVRAAGELLTA